MFVFEGKGCEKILREAQEYEQEWLMRHSFLFCLSIAQTGSKLLLSLIPLQFPAAPSLKALNEIINILLCSLCSSAQAWQCHCDGQSEVQPLLWSQPHTSLKTWNVRNCSQEPALSLVLAFLSDFLFCCSVIFVLRITPSGIQLGIPG